MSTRRKQENDQSQKWWTKQDRTTRSAEKNYLAVSQFIRIPNTPSCYKSRAVSHQCQVEKPRSLNAVPSHPDINPHSSPATYRGRPPTHRPLIDDPPQKLRPSVAITRLISRPDHRRHKHVQSRTARSRRVHSAGDWAPTEARLAAVAGTVRTGHPVRRD